MLFDYNKKNGLIRMYGIIGCEIDEADMMLAFDTMGGDDVTIRLQSPGGDVICGLSIHNQIANYPGKVTVEIDALAASIASVLMLAADTITMSKVGRVMVHRAWLMAAGNASDFRNSAELLDGFDRDIAASYAERSGKSADHWMGLMEDETYLNTTDAIASGLIDGITNGDEPSKKQSDIMQNSKPIASIAAMSGLGPRTNTMVQAMRLRQKMVDNGTLTRNP